jgi:hypothetical protein
MHAQHALAVSTCLQLPVGCKLLLLEALQDSKCRGLSRIMCLHQQICGISRVSSPTSVDMPVYTTMQQTACPCSAFVNLMVSLSLCVRGVLAVLLLLRSCATAQYVQHTVGLQALYC